MHYIVYKFMIASIQFYISIRMTRSTVNLKPGMSYYALPYLVREGRDKTLLTITISYFYSSLCIPPSGQYPWPSLAEVNTRARRYISAWIKQLRREELKQAHLLKVNWSIATRVFSLPGLH